MTIPIIDLFAGPGGLGEGFSRESSVRFQVAVSIEKDPMAHETLRLRAAHRLLSRAPGVSSRTWALWDEIVARAKWNTLFDELRNCGNSLIETACAQADGEALKLELGPDNRIQATSEIRNRLLPFMKQGRLPANTVLIGGPPCQAYSIVGRSRNKGKAGYRAEDDHRHYLYQEYLNVISEFEPAVFVMENVKGILSSTIENAQIFETIINDLKCPGRATKSGEKSEYVLCTLCADDSSGETRPEDFLVRAENHGVPQARHRVIILGVRKDVYSVAGSVRRLRKTKAPSVRDVIGDLPMLRPELSYRGEGMTWLDSFADPLFKQAVKELQSSGKAGKDVAARMVKTVSKLKNRKSDPGSGAERARRRKELPPKAPLAYWYQDRAIGVLTNHESRSHMPTDLIRYLFVAAFGMAKKGSPRLQDFPKCLLPEHKNVNPDNPDESPFKDRFRVQVAGQHSMTITSHIAKDGHAFIHPGVSQCRSLTVREAARLQTFPDSYVFLGPRTAQFTQVGNAVPPYLARQIAGIVANVLDRAGLTSEATEEDTLSRLAA
jgi:DNA (cytosine-5)-methyltransferase 1